MTHEEAKTHIEALAKKADGAQDSGDALRFSQAAANLANALCGLNSPDLRK